MYEIALVPNFVAWIAIAILALIAGSFLNVVIYRLPLILRQQWHDEARALLAETQHTQSTPKLSLLYPSSHCTQCATPILWRHKIPLLSYIFLRGKCAYCRKPICISYPIVELLTMVTWLTVFAIYGFSYLSVAGAWFVSCLIALACIDQNEGYLVDEITVPLIWIGLLLNCFATIVSAEQAIWGAVAGYVSFFLLNLIFKAIRGRPGLGGGDMKLLAALGAWLGWELLPAMVLIASLSGLAFYCILHLRRRYALSDAIPFGPYLAFSGILSFLFHPQLKTSLEFIRLL